MGIKTLPKLVIEKGEPVFGTNRVKLIGTEALADADIIFSESIKSNKIGSYNCSFSVCYGCGCEFLYKIDQLKDGKTLRGEVGRGYIEKDNDEYFLIRLNPFYILDEHQNVTEPLGRILDFPPEENSFILVSNYISNNPQELLLEDGCVLTSIAPHVLHPVQLTKDTILGRTDFGSVKALKLSNLWNIEAFAESVVKSMLSYAKQLVFKTTQLEVKKLKTSQIILRPSAKAVEQAGTVFLDEDSGKLKIYDGSSWRTFVYEDT
jgi:hypothetical protein